MVFHVKQKICVAKFHKADFVYFYLTYTSAIKILISFLKYVMLKEHIKSFGSEIYVVRFFRH